MAKISKKKNHNTKKNIDNEKKKGDKDHGP